MATRAALVTAAAQVLARRGYAGTTTNHVAERAGVSIGTLYEYFRDKDELVTAVVDAHLTDGEALLAARTAELSPDAPLPAVVAALVDGMMHVHAAEPRLHRVLSSQVPQTRANTARAEALEARLTVALAAVLGRARALAPREARLTAQICVHAVEALVHRWILDEAGAPAPRATLARELERMILGYLAAPATR